MKNALPFLLALLMAIPTAAADELSAKQIIDKSLDQNTMGFQSGEANLTLTIEDKAGEKRVRKLDVKSKRASGLTKTKVVLTAPQDVKGQAFLFSENSGEDDVWMFLPAFGVTRRIEGGQKKGAFLGSHFSYSDLESRDIKDASYKRLADAKVGKAAVYVIEATPKSGSQSDYTKVVVYIRKTDNITLKAKFFKGDAEVKTIFVEKLDKTSNGQTYAKQVSVQPKVGGYTRITIGKLNDAAIPEATFSKDNLGK